MKMDEHDGFMKGKWRIYPQRLVQHVLQGSFPMNGQKSRGMSVFLFDGNIPLMPWVRKSQKFQRTQFLNGGLHSHGGTQELMVYFMENPNRMDEMGVPL